MIRPPNVVNTLGADRSRSCSVKKTFAVSSMGSFPLLSGRILASGKVCSGRPRAASPLRGVQCPRLPMALMPPMALDTS